jgi:hypothetical protein
MENLNGVANFGGTYPAMIWRAYSEPVHDGLPVLPFPECPKPDRRARIVIGAGNPFLNGWRMGSSGSTSRRSSTGGGRRGATTTTAPRPVREPDDAVNPDPGPPTQGPPESPPGQDNPNRGRD